MAGDPDKEYGTNKPPPAGRVRERSRGDTTYRSIHFTESLLLASILAERCVCNQERLWIRMIGQSHPETNPITIKPKIAWQSSSPGFPYLLLSTRVPFPNKISCFVSTGVSSDNSFPSVRQEPSFGPWKGSPFLQFLPLLHILRITIYQAPCKPLTCIISY